jgi:hypothetical protein
MDLHLSIGEGQSDASGAAFRGVNKLVPPLPSTGESGPGAVPHGETSSISLLPSAPDPGLPKPPLGSMPIDLIFQIVFLNFLNLQVKSVSDDRFCILELCGCCQHGFLHGSLRCSIWPHLSSHRPKPSIQTPTHRPLLFCLIPCPTNSFAFTACALQPVSVEGLPPDNSCLPPHVVADALSAVIQSAVTALSTQDSPLFD